MKKKPTKPPAAKSGRARKDDVMMRAREIAASGSCLNFSAVLARLEPADATVLKLWASAHDRDEIDRSCNKALEPHRQRRR